MRAGEALLLDDTEVDLVDLVNRASELRGLLLDPDADPSEYRPAEVLVEHLVDHYGTKRHANGERVVGVESGVRRYLLPFLVELSAGREPGRRGIGDLRFLHVDQLPSVLAGHSTRCPPRPSPGTTWTG